ncbi:MAG TPA: baseplate J/gp47 family protein [Ktedonobacteraceae bacterium]|nr:baseplate J/gp47 family protein [Ktedonobacteraceae bacterium]
MRQGNGTDLLGTTDSQGAAIGIIYVAPTDDRKSVLTAILTLDKLGKQQVAIVLPNQNSAFQRAVDFDDLKSLRRKLSVQLVFIAQSGAGPAELARQRRFTVYSSLDSYAEALRDQARQQGRGLFGSARYTGAMKAVPGKVDASSHTGMGTTPEHGQEEAPDFDDFEQSEPGDMVDTDKFGEPDDFDDPLVAAPDHPDQAGSREAGKDQRVPAMMGGAVAAGAVAEGAEALHQGDQHTSPGADETVDGVDAISLGDVGDVSDVGDDYQDDDEEEDFALPPRTQPGTTGPTVPIEETRKGSNSGPTSRPSGPGAPEPIELMPVRSSGGRSTLKLAPPSHKDFADEDFDSFGDPVSRKRSSGKLAAVGFGALGAAGAAATVHRRSTGKLPAYSSGMGAGIVGGGGNGGARLAKRDRRVRPLVAALLILAVLLIVGGIIFSLSGAPGSPLKGIVPGTTAPATVTITPDSKVVSNSYVILGVTNGKADNNQRQVNARTLTSQPQSQTKTITGSGHNQVPAARARGRLTFFNGSFTSFSVSAGERFNAGNGVFVTNDTLVTIPAAVPGGNQGSASVEAHATNAGSVGNVAAGSISGTCCTASNSVFVHNSAAFSGGQDAKNYNFVQQGDVNAFVNGVKEQLTTKANDSLKSSLKSGEQLAAATNCPAQVNTSAPIGDLGRDVPTTNATVSVTCKSMAYDQAGMTSIVSKLLQSKATTDAGPGYALKGNIVVHPQVQSMTANGSVTLLVSAQGLWVYQFTAQQKQQLAKQIAGKSTNDAKTLLASQAGVHNVSISVNNSVLPNDANQISMVVQDVPGLQNTGAGGTSSSLPLLPTSTPATQPGNG